MKYNILVVEDEKDISEIVNLYMKKEGFNVFEANDGFKALEIFNREDIHLILLDVMMPGIDGFEVLEKIRNISEVPIIMVTAKQQEIDRLNGFEKGADDYVIKPFSVKELVKRANAILKRVYKENLDIVYTHENLKLELNSMKLYKNDEEVIITAAEFSLLMVFFKNKNQILSREQIIHLAYGLEYEGYDRNIDSYIKKIRQKIEDNPKEPKFLVTKYGAGYMFGGN